MTSYTPEQRAAMFKADADKVQREITELDERRQGLAKLRAAHMTKCRSVCPHAVKRHEVSHSDADCDGLFGHHEEWDVCTLCGKEFREERRR
jgi:hypothetical protein